MSTVWLSVGSIDCISSLWCSNCSSSCCSSSRSHITLYRSLLSCRSRYFPVFGGILRFRNNIWHFIQAFSINTIAWFWFRSNLFFQVGMCLCWWTIWVPEDTSRQWVFLSFRLIWNTAVGFGRSALLKFDVTNCIEIINCGLFSAISLGFWHIEMISNYYLSFYSSISIHTIAWFWCRATDEGLLTATIVYNYLIFSYLCHLKNEQVGITLWLLG